jgi:6-phosphogluconolactonase
MATGMSHLLFVGSYAPAERPGIHAFDFDESAGLLPPRGSFAGVANPSFLVIHPSRRWLYAASETSLADDGRHGAVYAFHVELEPLAIQMVNHRSTDGDWPCHLAIDGSGRWLLASNYGTGNVAVYPIKPDGSLGEVQSFVQHYGQGPNQARQEGPHAHSTTLTPDNHWAIVADLGIDQLVMYRLDASSGQLSLHTAIRTRPGAGPRHIAFHPDGRRLYLANELDSTVTAYEYDADQGELRELQTLDTLPAGAPENSVADIHVSPSGQRLYVSNRGHSSVAVFGVEPDGRLTSLGFASCGGEWPRNFGLSPGGRFMLVANRHSNDVVVLPVESAGVELGGPVTRVTVSQPSCIRFLNG